MAFTLPSDLPTDYADGSSTMTAAKLNNISAMGNAIKAALGTIGYGTQSTSVSASETTTSASYADLTTTTDQVTVTIGSSGSALLFFGAQLTNSGANYCYIGVGISGATTTAASDTTCIQAAVHSGGVLKNYSNTLLLTGLTAGVTTFKLKYKTNSGTATFANRRISVIPMPATDGTRADGQFSLDALSSVAVGMSGTGYNRPQFDAVGAGAHGGGATWSWSHVIGANAKAVLVFLNPQNNTLSSSTPPAFSGDVGGTALTQLGAWYSYNASGYISWMLCFGLLNPPTGTKTITMNGPASYTALNSVSYNDVAYIGAVTSFHDGNAAASANPSITASNVTPDQVVVAGFTGYTQSFSSVTPNSRAIDNYVNGRNLSLAIGDADGPASTIGMTATSGAWSAIGVQLYQSMPKAAFSLNVTPAIQMSCPTANLGVPSTATVATSETTASGTYADLTTVTDTVTVTVPASGMVLVSISADSSAGGYFVSYALSGANTRAADDAHSFNSVNSGNNIMGIAFLETGLSAGSTTFKMKYKSGTFANRRITVTPLGG